MIKRFVAVTLTFLWILNGGLFSAFAADNVYPNDAKQKISAERVKAYCGENPAAYWATDGNNQESHNYILFSNSNNHTYRVCNMSSSPEYDVKIFVSGDTNDFTLIRGACMDIKENRAQAYSSVKGQFVYGIYCRISD